MSAVIAWSVLRSAGEDLFPGPSVAADAPQTPVRGEPDGRLLRDLERLMTVERVYRLESLTIGSLSSTLGVPEYRLRRTINQGLGYRNFPAFLNRYRLEDAKAALADPAQSGVPVLTIAMDAGFQSLPPFNRAFKAETGLTPTQYRRLNLSGTGG
jgi:AraC-like DNA-binding protein